jgi:hypothetical protein
LIYHGKPYVLKFFKGNDMISHFNRLVPVAVAGVFLGLTTTSFATQQRVEKNFQVKVNLVSQCQLAIPNAVLEMTYNAFQSTVSTGKLNATVKCSKGLSYTLALAGSKRAGGTLLGLNYALKLPIDTGTGNGSDQTYKIDGTIAAGQIGECGTDNKGSDSSCSATSGVGDHILVLSY